MNYRNIVAAVVVALCLTESSHGLRCHECIGAVGPLGEAYPDIAMSVGFLRYPVLDGCSAGKESNRTVECPDIPDIVCGKDYYEFTGGSEKAGMTIRGCALLENGEMPSYCVLNRSNAYVMRVEGELKTINPLELLKKSKQNVHNNKGNSVSDLEVHSCICDSDDCNKGVGSQVYRNVSNLATGLIERMLNQM